MSEISMNKETALKLLKNMWRIRRMEELCAELYTRQKIRGFLHLYIGEEAVATGVLAHAKKEDYIVATYREHAHALLKGLSAKEIMAEMFAKKTGCSRGRGGSMHLFSHQHKLIGGNAIVGGGLPLAAGLGLSIHYKKKFGLSSDASSMPVVFCFFGEGAMAEGAFHEAMNLAVLWELPVIFCCENNLYAMGTALNRAQSQTDLCKKAQAYEMQTASIDGMNVEEVFNKTKTIVDTVRTTGRPYFVELKTYRFRAHSMYDPDLYRSKDEVEKWKQHCPIQNWQQALIQQSMLTENEINAIKAEAEAEMSEAVNFAENSEFEDISDIAKFIYAEEDKTVQSGGVQ